MNRRDMRKLGQVGQPLLGGSYRPRRRLRLPRWALATVGIALLSLMWTGISANRQVEQESAQPAFATVPVRPAAADQVSRSAVRTDPDAAFAAVDGMNLLLPHAQPTAVAFHEATRVDAQEMLPLGQLLANDNPTRFDPPVDMKGPGYRVLSSRGRARPATSAVDVVVPLGDAAVAPVTGTVTAVTEYPLYGRTRDWRVEITPQGRPDLNVVLIHLLKPHVAVGDTVVAGTSSIGVVRLLPFDSHVDYVTQAKQPHVHIEVTPAVDPEAIDPNQPALPAEETAAEGS